MSGQRVVVATATKNLQDQLAQKDAPTVAANTPGVRVAVLKGKQNYLCRNRVHSVGGAAQLSFDDGTDVPKGVADQMRRILQWSNETETGDRDELPFEVDQRAWRQTVGHAAGVPSPRQLSPGPELLRRTGQGPRRRVVDPHRQHPPLRLAPGLGLDAPAGARVRRLRRGARDRRHLRLPARHLAQRHATARARRRGATAVGDRVPGTVSGTRRRSPTASLPHCRSSTTATSSPASTRTAPANLVAPTNSWSPWSRDFARSRRAAPTRRPGRSAPSDRPSTWPMTSRG